MLFRIINKKIIIFLISVCPSLLSGQIESTSDGPGDRLYGVTIDRIDSAYGGLNEIIPSLKNLSVKPTTRVVFDERQPALYYQTAVESIKKVSYVMGEILDSYLMKSHTIKEFEDRVVEYMNTLNDGVDIWEIGNEVNGEWLGDPDTVSAKIMLAFRLLKEKNKVTALTFYYNQGCFENSENEMFGWIQKNISNEMKTGLDYVFISYYEDDCNGILPDWQQIFDSLHAIFPNSKLGIGECGTKNKVNKEEFIKRYYGMKINTPNYVGGYFWWYFRQDCVPRTKPLWEVLNEAIKRTK